MVRYEHQKRKTEELIGQSKSAWSQGEQRLAKEKLRRMEAGSVRALKQTFLRVHKTGTGESKLKLGAQAVGNNEKKRWAQSGGAG